MVNASGNVVAAPLARPAGEASIVMLESGGWGGIAHYSYNLCQALEEAGCGVTLQTGAPYELDTMPRGFELKTFEPKSTYSDRWKTLRATLGTAGADLLHLQSTISARRDWLRLARLRRTGVRLVTTAHNVLPHDREERDAFGMRWAFGRIYKTSAGIIVHGEETKRQIMEMFDIPEHRLAVIPHGDYGFAAGSLDRSESRRRLGFAQTDLLILAFGAMREYKGIPDLIDAFAAIAADIPAARLLVVGKPIRADPDDFRRRIADLDLGDRVTLRPEYVPFADIGNYFAACDVAAFPYRDIYQSGAIQLAYAAGRPVVATRVGELTTTVRDGWNGLLAPPADPVALANALRDMLSRSHEERDRMGRRSLQLAAEQHSWSDAAAATLELYRRVAGPGG
jgi:glycosyltransferase involved in cell wall biosynthesis